MSQNNTPLTNIDSFIELPKIKHGLQFDAETEEELIDSIKKHFKESNVFGGPKNKKTFVVGYVALYS